MVKVVGLLMSATTVFTMCQDGPAPEKCCRHGDQLNVIMTQSNWVQRCEDMGGKPVNYVCRDVDF